MNLLQQISYINLQIRGLACKLNNLSGGGNAVETDPTVPIWVKGITQVDISKWNSIQEVDTLATVTQRGNKAFGATMLFNPENSVSNAGVDGGRNTAIQGLPNNNINFGSYRPELGTLGNNNVSIGLNNQPRSTGNENTSVGGTSFVKLTDSSYNTAIGFNTLPNLESVSFLGPACTNTTFKSNSNVAVGHSTLRKLKSGLGNTAIGTLAGGNLGANLPSNYNTFIGCRSSSTTLNSWGDYNIIIGANNPMNGLNEYRLSIHAQAEYPTCLPNGNTDFGFVTPLIGGNFRDRWLSIGGKFRLNKLYSEVPANELGIQYDVVGMIDGEVKLIPKRPIPTFDPQNLAIQNQYIQGGTNRLISVRNNSNLSIYINDDSKFIVSALSNSSIQLMTQIGGFISIVSDFIAISPLRYIPKGSTIPVNRVVVKEENLGTTRLSEIDSKDLILNAISRMTIAEKTEIANALRGL